MVLPRRPLRLALVLAALAAAAAGAPAPGAGGGTDDPRTSRPPLERPGILELTLPEVAGVRVEHFRLDTPGAALGDAPIGIARLLRVPEPGGGARLEWETRFFEPAVRVLLVERLAHDAINVVWRELGDGGRTVHVAWDLTRNAVEVRDATGAAIRRHALDAEDGLCTPLFLQEQARGERLSTGEFRRLEPGGCTAETLRFTVEPAFPAPGVAARGMRFTTWRRTDGSLAGRSLWRQRELLGYQIQAGGPVARRIAAEDHAALEQRHRAPLARR